MKYMDFLSSDPLQFDFKSEYTPLHWYGCVSRYIHRGTSVLGCFLDATKAFDNVDHGLLFQQLLERILPIPVIRFF